MRLSMRHNMACRRRPRRTGGVRQRGAISRRSPRKPGPAGFHRADAARSAQHGRQRRSGLSSAAMTAAAAIKEVTTRFQVVGKVAQFEGDWRPCAEQADRPPHPPSTAKRGVRHCLRSRTTSRSMAASYLTPAAQFYAHQVSSSRCLLPDRWRLSRLSASKAFKATTIFDVSPVKPNMPLAQEGDHRLAGGRCSDRIGRRRR